jgi:predicted nucleotidyltransferase
VPYRSTITLQKIPLGRPAMLPLSRTVKARLRVDDHVVADFCRQHQIRRLALFGSVLQDSFRPDSDLDVLVEFEPGQVPGFGFITIQDQLSQLFGRSVDLHTPKSLSRYFRDRVLEQAQTLYAA